MVHDINVPWVNDAGTERKTMSQDKKKDAKKKSLRAGIIAFGATAVLYGVVFHPTSIAGLVLGACVSLIVGKVVSIMATDLDLTTHNKQDRAANEAKKDVEELPLSGDETADAVITKGQEMLRQIREANEAIPDEKLTEQMNEITAKCVQIFRTVAEKPGKATVIRKFMNYYLPTTLKMLTNYRTMLSRGVSEKDMTEAHETMTRGLDMVLTACQKQLDNLYKDNMLDVSTDIDVLEQMLKRDGFMGDAVETMNATQAKQEARTAAAQQMQQTDVPTLKVPDAEEFIAEKQQKKEQH